MYELGNYNQMILTKASNGTVINDLCMLLYIFF